MSTGEKVKRLRLQHGWTQDDMERVSGIDQGYISSIECGRRKRLSGEILLKLARALGCTIEDLEASSRPRAA